MAVTYEAGPTGFGLARALTDGRIDCRVAAPSKLIRPSGDRVKTDARDAAHLARLLHLGQITAVTIPTPTQEAARDLVRAREDCRGDLMRVRHRVSKLLLRQGSSTPAGRPGPVCTRLGCAATVRRPGTAAAYDSRFDAMLAGVDRRDRLDDAIAALAADSEFTPVVHRLGCFRGISTLTAFGLAVEIGDWTPIDRALDRRLRRSGAQRVLLGCLPGRRARSPRPATPTSAGCWSRRPGTTAAYRPGPRCWARWDKATRPAGPRTCRQPSPAPPVVPVRRPQEAPSGRQRRDRPRAGRLVLVTGHPDYRPHRLIRVGPATAR